MSHAASSKHHSARDANSWIIFELSQGSIQGAYEDALCALRTLLHGDVTAFQPGKATVTAQKAMRRREYYYFALENSSDGSRQASHSGFLFGSATPKILRFPGSLHSY